MDTRRTLRRSLRVQSNSKIVPKSFTTQRSRVVRRRKPKPTECEFCSKILDAFRVEQEDPIYLGSPQEVMSSSKCSVHPSLLLAAFGKIDLRDSPVTGIKVVPTDQNSITFVGRISSDESRYSFALHLLRRRLSRHYACVGRVIDPPGIDGRMFQRWKTRCENEHNKDCQICPAAAWLPPPALSWLIDTSQRCLVPALPGTTYVALSYVWGNVPMLKTVRADLIELQKYGALASERQSSPIPQTILDAMTVTALLGERYLWVDSLCITQDDEEARHAQISGMGSIYANASITIIAEQGEDANFGLRGLPGRHPQPRMTPLERFRLRKGWEIYYSRSSTTTQHSRSSWHGRGWTFQEHLFSRRRLIFGSDRVRWECHHAKWYNDIEERTDIQFPFAQNQIVRGQDMFTINHPDLGGYNYLARNYNWRELTYPEDALAAFSGITTALCRTFAGGFLCGLPVMFFDVGLLWHGTRTLDRRVSCKLSVVGDCLPSWSWVGWRGEVYPWSWYQGMDYIKHSGRHTFGSGTERRVTPILEWYSLESISSKPEPILSSWYSYRSKFVRGDGKVPKGWARHVFRPTDQPGYYPEPGVTPHYFYKHKSDPMTEFWYPIPLVDNNQSSMLNPVASLISCRTLRTWLFVGKAFDVYGEPCVTVRDKSGRWAGMLHLAEPLPSHPPEGERGTATKQQCELVMLSRGCSPLESFADILEELYDEDFLTVLGTKKTYEYYNVLWIEWQDGIAYRKAVGRIEEQTWEREATEWIDLILG